MTAVHEVPKAQLMERRELIASMLGELGVVVDRHTWRFDPAEVMELMQFWQEELDEIRRLLGSDA